MTFSLITYDMGSGKLFNQLVSQILLSVLAHF